MSQSTRDPTRRFLRGWRILALCYLPLLAGGWALLYGIRDGRSAWLWVLPVGAVLAYELAFLAVNRRRFLTGKNLGHIWGLANLLTLFRGALIALLAGFLFAPKPQGWAGWLPAMFYTIAAAVDYADGFWAKRTGTQTAMGALLDSELDGVGILLAITLAVRYRILPAAFIIVGLARYAFLLGLQLRKLRGLPVCELPPSSMRRRLAGFQMGILAVFLWPIARPPGTTLAQSLVGVPLLLGFLRDYLIASGRLDPDNPRYVYIKELLGRLARRWLPALLRLFLAVYAGIFLVGAISMAVRAGIPAAGWFPAGLPQAEVFTLIFLILEGLTLLALVAGRFTSVSALILLLLQGLRIFLSGMDPVGAMVATAALLLYLLGPGPLRLELANGFASGEARIRATRPAR